MQRFRTGPGSFSAAALALAMLLLAACASTTAPAPVTGRPTAAPTAVATYPPLVIPTPPPAPASVVASARPLQPMPQPGQMPSGSYMQQILQRGKLVAGVYDDVLLFGFLNPLTNQYEGVDIDLVHQIAQAIFGDPNKVEFKIVPSDQRMPWVMNGTVDLVAASMTINADRRTQVDFSEVYYDAGQRVMTYKSSASDPNHPLRGVADLSGRTVCSVTGSTGLEALPTLNPYAKTVAVPQYTDCLVLLQEGKVSAVVTDDIILAGLVAQDPTLTLVGDRFTDEPYGIAISKAHPEMTAFVNGVLEQLRQGGELATICQTWLGQATCQGQPPAPVYQ